MSASFSGEKSAMRVIAAAIIAIVFLLLATSTGYLMEYNPAGDILVIQHTSGSLAVYTEPGYKWQLLGHATHYRKSFQYWFTEKSDQGESYDQSIRVRFNDGGHAQVSGSVRVDLPTDEKSILDIHSTFGSLRAVEDQLIRTVIEKSVYMTGPLMSSKESYAEKRNDLINLFEDQAAKGVYQTIQTETELADSLSGEKRRTTIVQIRKENGQYLRQEISPLARFGIKIYNLSINDIKYDPNVEKQIAAQQEATMQVQTAMANAKKAEQEAVTTAKQGEASAAAAKWEQETLNARLVTQMEGRKKTVELEQEMVNARLVKEAEGRRQAAELDKETADLEKQRQILLGQGEAEKKKLLMDANNALDAKLDAYVQVNRAYAAALGSMQVPLVPSMVFGGQGSGSAGGTNTAQDFIELMKMKTARDLALDLGFDKSADKGTDKHVTVGRQ